MAQGLLHIAVDGVDDGQQQQRVGDQLGRKRVAVEEEQGLLQLVSDGPMREAAALAERDAGDEKHFGEEGADGQQPARGVEALANPERDEHQRIGLGGCKHGGECRIGPLRPGAEPWAVPEHAKQAVERGRSEAYDGDHAGKPYQQRALVELEQRKQQEPQSNVLQCENGLQPAQPSGKTYVQAQPFEEHVEDRCAREQRHPQQHALGAVAEPCQQAQQRHQPIQGVHGEVVLPAPHPAVIVLRLYRGDGLGTADNGYRNQAAALPRVERDQGRFPHAQGQNAVAHVSQAEGLIWRTQGKRRMGRHGTVPAHEPAIPIDFVCVIDVTDEHGEIGLGAGSNGQVNVLAVPGEAGVVGVALLSPGRVGA